MSENNQIQPVPISINVGKALRPFHAGTKLIPSKKKKFLEYLTKQWNVTAAATSIGVTRQAIAYALENDEQFAIAYQQVKDGNLDFLEDTSFTVACQPDHKGYNDRKLLLQAHRKEYSPKQDIGIDIHVNVNLSGIEVSRMLDNSPQDIDFTELNKDKTP